MVVLVGLWGYGGDHAAKALMSYRSIAAGPTAKLLRQIVDLDADGTSALLGGGDCDDFDERVNPHAIQHQWAALVITGGGPLRATLASVAMPSGKWPMATQEC